MVADVATKRTLSGLTPEGMHNATDKKRKRSAAWDPDIGMSFIEDNPFELALRFRENVGILGTNEHVLSIVALVTGIGEEARSVLRSCTSLPPCTKDEAGMVSRQAVV